MKCYRTGCLIDSVGQGLCLTHGGVDKKTTSKAYWARRRQLGLDKTKDEWYNTKDWQNRRRNQLYLFPVCWVCKENGYLAKATDIDHIKPHRGNKKLFEDPNNLQSLCKSCHSVKTVDEKRQREIKEEVSKLIMANQ